MTKLIDAVTTAQKEKNEKLQEHECKCQKCSLHKYQDVDMNEEILTHLQNLVKVCYHETKLSINDIVEVKYLIEKIEEEIKYAKFYKQKSDKIIDDFLARREAEKGGN